HHFIKARRYQAGEADDVYLFRLGFLQDRFARHHHAEIDHFEVVAAQDDTDDVLADVVHITLHRREQHFRASLPGRARRGFLGFHERREIGHGLFHHAGRLYYLWQKHLAGPEQVADDAHAVHQRPLNNRETARILLPGFLGVFVDVFD